MLPEISKIKGIHPGVILKREIISRKLKNKELAASLNEFAQTIGAIIKGKRAINANLSVKLGRELGVESDYFMVLQAHHDVQKALSNKRQYKIPDLRKIRKVLFWDTNFNEIDWTKSRRAIIKRVFERGNDEEIKEIIGFYGLEITKMEIKNIGSSYSPSFMRNVDRYLNTNENIQEYGI